MGVGEHDAEKVGEEKLDGAGTEGIRGVVNDVPMEPRTNGHRNGNGHENEHRKGKERDSSAEGEGSGGGHVYGHGNGIGKHPNAKLNPEEYQHARKRLKKAVLEYYRYASSLSSISSFVVCSC